MTNIDYDAIRHQFPLKEVVSRYCTDLTQKGSKWWCVCPFHEDHKPSLNIFRAKDGFYRYKCFACDETGDVIDFVANIESCSTTEAIKRLTGGALPEVGQYIRQELPPSEEEVWKPIVPVPDHAPKYDPKKTYNPAQGKFKNYAYRLERIDDYRNADGELEFHVVRCNYETTKNTPTISWCVGPDGEERWCAKRPAPPHPIHGLHELVTRPDDKVILVSGEKCRAALGAMYPGCIVISWLGGDGNVKNTDWSPLVGRTILQWSDADSQGKNAMNKIFKIVDEIERSGTG